MNFDASQLRAIDMAKTGRDILITGGAGTGKTTIIKEIAGYFNNKVDILAPTGKASARLKEATGLFAQTVHRYLGWDSQKFRQIPRNNRTIIVDESSMMDSWLLSSLLRTKAPQIILVGDAGQLPPVGRGQPFHDLLKLKPDNVCRLEHCWRSKSSVHIAANMISRGETPPMEHKEGGESWKVIMMPNPVNVEDMLCKWVSQDKFDFEQDIIVASKYGTEDTEGNIKSLNKRISDIVNPHDENEAWKPGDRVICNKNFGPDDLWNGDLGTVIDVDLDGKPCVELDRMRKEGAITLNKAMQRETTLAYCLSVHKSQGSQFRNVVFVCLKQHRYMLSRSLIYTAVTRTKTNCVVIGDYNAFRSGIQKVEDKKTIIQALGGK